MRIIFPHKPQPHGGPGSFQLRIEKILKNSGWNIGYAGEQNLPDVIMVVGGTRKLGWLIRNKMRGIPVIYRLDGINWLHRKNKVSIKKWLLNETRNYLSQFIRSFCASHVIYQSQFVKDWWLQKGWPAKAENSIIHNGVDLNEFRNNQMNSQPISILCVEGNLDYSPYSIELLNTLQERLIGQSEFQSLILYGGFQSKENRKKLDPNIDYRGVIPRSELSEVYRNSIYISLDVNAACPNTVIEALASGIPVIGFDTGALKELVGEVGGIVVPYGSDPWELGFPDIDALCKAAIKVKENWDSYSVGARKLAEEKYDINVVVQKYIEVIESQINKLNNV